MVTRRVTLRCVLEITLGHDALHHAHSFHRDVRDLGREFEPLPVHRARSVVRLPRRGWVLTYWGDAVRVASARLVMKRPSLGGVRRRAFLARRRACAWHVSIAMRPRNVAEPPR